ncbi:DnaJ domain-containing protein [Colletotrichum karsti]|uniref:DnaJ domain-containing protein n=1 Tax=Colletotrichum karsti TaxID=1095194 RepID=A0A9P6LFF9_9PEZI|nr:DnaJ domain-containing protein [Colletotrichum karsti]KAF9871438.1 DnaJ domain-containing protein [Colletotrichum karsti]
MEPPDVPDYYDDLGVEQTATAEEVRRAHKVLALKHHPDKLGPGNCGDAHEFRKIQEAFEFLRDDAKRYEYDLNYKSLRQKWNRYRAWQKHQAEEEAKRREAERQAQEEVERQRASQSSWTREARQRAERNGTPTEAQQDQWEAFLVAERMIKERIAAKWTDIRTRCDKKITVRVDTAAQRVRNQTHERLRKREEEIRREIAPFFEEERRKAIAKAIGEVHRRLDARVEEDIKAFHRKRKVEEKRIINRMEDQRKVFYERALMRAAEKEAEEKRKAMEDFQARIREWQEEKAARETVGRE